MNLRAIDLNLLPVLEAIYVERSLTRASGSLHITQPAVSNALARLRSHFDDPLFVRHGRGVRPTAMTEALMPSVRDALDRLRSSLEPKSSFDPPTSTRVFNLSGSDTSALVIAPQIASILQQTAPNVRIRWAQVDRPSIALDLASGRLDLALDIPGVKGAGLSSEMLYSGEMQCILNPTHPNATGPLTLDKFLSLRHIAVSSRREGLSLVEQMVRAAGHRIIPAMHLPHHLAALEVVRQTDFVLAASESLARDSGLAIQPLPLPGPDLAVTAYWRHDNEEDPGLIWLRDVLREIALSL